jgi:hypothetical protein
MQDGRAYAQAGDQPYGHHQIINIVYALIFNTRVYTDGCKEWEKNDILEKTWDNFKAHFTTEHRLYRKQSRRAQASGFYTTNHAQKGMQINMLAGYSLAITMQTRLLSLTLLQATNNITNIAVADITYSESSENSRMHYTYLHEYTILYVHSDHT